MFDETLKQIQDAQANLSYLDSSLTDLQDSLSKFEKDFQNFRRRFAYRRDSVKRPNRIHSEIVKQLKKEAPATLIRNMDSAISVNTEFDESTYRLLLYEAAKQEEIYKFVKQSEGWSVSISVQVVLEESAGTLADYGRGITAYREAIKSKQSAKENAGRKATLYWYNNIYTNPIKLNKTIMGRVTASGRKAPFWQLLNSGTTSLSSDRGDGSYNPIPSSPTDFIGETENELRRRYTLMMLPEYTAWVTDVQGMRAELERAQGIREEIRGISQQISTDFAQSRQIIKKLGKSKQYIDENKLAEAIRKYKAGEEFDNRSIELTKSGAPSRTRITARRLEGLIEY